MQPEEMVTFTVKELIEQLEKIKDKNQKVFIPGYHGHARVVQEVVETDFIFKSNGEPLRVLDRYVGDKKDTYIEKGVELS